MPAIFKILTVFGATLLVTRLKLHLGLALILGGLALHLWAGAAPADAFSELGASVFNMEFIFLFLITTLIIEIGRYITSEKNADEIVGAVRRWGGTHGALYVLMGLPAVIGLIPMPAGALFSAPFVQQTGERIEGGPDWKSAVNYWFRHVWEYWWPLYPGVITAMWLFDMLPSWQYFSVQVLFTPVAFAAGYVFLLRRHVARLSTVSASSGGTNRRALFLMLPIAVVLLFAVLGPSIFAHFFGKAAASGQVVRLGAVLAGLVAALTLVVCDDLKRGNRVFFKSMLKWSAWNVMFSLWGVLVFKHMMEASGLLPVAAAELADSGMPVELVVALLPFTAGIVTGIALGFTGAAFPLVAALVNAGSISPLAALVLGYGFGYMGMMLSPVHLCLLVTKDYFAASLPAVYRQILPCTGVILCFALLMHAVMKMMGW